MRNKQSNRPEAHGQQQQRHGARSEYEATREDTSIGSPQYPHGYSQSQGGISPRYGAEYGSVDDAYPHASQQWQRDERSQDRGPSFGPDYESEYRSHERMQGSQFDPYAQSVGYQPQYASPGVAPRIEPGRSAWQDSGTRRMGQGYGASSGYGERSGYDSHGYGYGQGRIEERSAGHGYPQGFQGARGRSGEQNYGGQSRQASFQGRGPRNYTRSNERILEEVNERLTDDPWLDASEITVRCVEGRVQLEGHVRDRWMKHRAEDLVDACMGVRDIDNRLRIQGAGESLSASGQSETSLSETANTSRGQGMAGSQATTSPSNRPAH